MLLPLRCLRQVCSCW